MKLLLLTTIAAVLLVGCVTKQLQKTKAIPIQQPEPTTAKAPDISMLLAVAKGNIEAVKQHLAAGTNVNAIDVDGETPLHKAALMGHKKIAELLISAGADANVKFRDGTTPLDWAVGHKHPEIANLIRKHGGKTGEELEAAAK